LLSSSDADNLYRRLMMDEIAQNAEEELSSYSREWENGGRPAITPCEGH
jgi:hypothetical protein